MLQDPSLAPSPTRAILIGRFFVVALVRNALGLITADLNVENGPNSCLVLWDRPPRIVDALPGAADAWEGPT